jgi:DNA-binding NarL/FixJ family response regulator
MGHLFFGYKNRTGGVAHAMINILIADDNSFIREGMKIILNTYDEFEVSATVGDGQEAVTYCQNHRVDIALLDVRIMSVLILWTGPGSCLP